jgi:hypothetical protein
MLRPTLPTTPPPAPHHLRCLLSSRTEEFVANARKIKLADGREEFAGSAFDTKED